MKFTKRSINLWVSLIEGSSNPFKSYLNQLNRRFNQFSTIQIEDLILIFLLRYLKILQKSKIHYFQSKAAEKVKRVLVSVIENMRIDKHWRKFKRKTETQSQIFPLLRKRKVEKNQKIFLVNNQHRTHEHQFNQKRHKEPT